VLAIGAVVLFDGVRCRLVLHNVVVLGIFILYCGIIRKWSIKLT